MSTVLQHRAVGDAVAWVDGRPITAADVGRRVASIRNEVTEVAMPAPGSPEDRRLRRWIVQTLVDERLLVRGARQLGIPMAGAPASPPTDHDVVAVFEAVVADIVIGDDQVRDHYERNLVRYRLPEQRRVDVAVVDDETLARRCATAAARTGLRDAAERTGIVVERRDLARGAVGGELERRVFAADPPELLAPIPTVVGWHVVEVLASRPAGCVPLEAVAETIRTDLLASARGERFDRWLAAARRDHARFAPGHDHPGDPRLPDSIHRH